MEKVKIRGEYTGAEPPGGWYRCIVRLSVPLFPKLPDETNIEFGILIRNIAAVYLGSYCRNLPIAVGAEGYSAFRFSHSRRRWSGRCFTWKSSNLALNPCPSGEAAIIPTMMGVLSGIHALRIRKYSLSSNE